MKDLLTVILAFSTLLLAVQTYRLSGAKKVAEYRQAWLEKLRENIARLFSEIHKFEHGKFDTVQVTYLMELIDLSLDMSKPLHAELKNALIPLAFDAEESRNEAVRIGFDRAGRAARTVIAFETKNIESSLKRWV